MAQNTPILGKIKSSESAASLDAKYGPYASKAAADAALGENGDDVITAGLTVGITRSDGSVKEFWYQPDGHGGFKLVEKQVAAQEETDPTVPTWAKQETKPSYTASEVGAIPDGDKGVANGVATLGSDGKVPQSQLPSYVDDVLEYPNQSSFPATGESGKIYVALDTNKTYRWGGSAYIEISQSLALGETSSTAFAGDRGKAIEDKIPSNASSSNKMVTASDLIGKVDKVSGTTPNNFASFDSNGDLQDSNCNEGTFIKGVQQNGVDLQKDEYGKVNVTVQDGENGASAYDLYEQAEIAAGRIPLSQEAWLASLKANIGEFKFVNYDGTAVSAFTTGGIGTPYSGTIDSLVAGTDTTPDVILLMNNTDGTTAPTKTMMITTQHDGSSGYEFVYAGDLQSAIPSNVVTTNMVDTEPISYSKNLVESGGVAYANVFKKMGKNLLNPQTCIQGKVIDRTTGNLISATQAEYATDYIQVSENGLYCNNSIGFGNVGGWAVYDSSKQYIRGKYGTNKAYSYQSGDAYIRWTIGSPSTAQVEEGNTETAYEPYNPILGYLLNLIGTSELKDRSVTAIKIALNSIVGDNIANNAVIRRIIANNAVGSSKLTKLLADRLEEYAGYIGYSIIENGKSAYSAVSSDNYFTIKAGTTIKNLGVGVYLYANSSASEHLTLNANGSLTVGYDITYINTFEAGDVNIQVVGSGVPILNNAVSTAKIQNNAVTTPKIADDNVTIEKVEFKDIIYGINRANPAACTYGKYIDANDGEAKNTSESSPRYVTDYIPVSENGLYCGGYKLYGSVGAGAVYGSNKNYIRGIYKTYTYQEGDAYVRWTVSVESVETPNLYVIEGTQAGEYTPYVAPKTVFKEQYIPEIQDGAVTKDKVAKGTLGVDEIEFFDSINIYDRVNDTGFEANKILNPDSGNTQDSNDYSTTGFIKVKPSTTYRCMDNIQTRTICFYNSSKAAIPSETVIFRRNFTTSENDAYIRVSLSHGYVNKFGLTEGSDIQAYQPYRKEMSSSLIRNDKVQFFIPSKIYVAVGRTIEIYYSQILLNAEKYNIETICDTGYNLDRKYKIVGTNNNIGNHSLQIIARDDANDVVCSAMVTIVVVSNVISEAHNVVDFGTSLTNGKPWLGEIHNLSSNLTIIGSRGTALQKHDGRSGATIDVYLNTNGANVYTFDEDYVGTGSNASTFNEATQYNVGDFCKRVISTSYGNKTAWYIFKNSHQGAWVDADAYNISMTNPLYDPDNQKVSIDYYKTFQNLNFDAIILEMGGNDISSGSPSVAADKFKTLVDKIREEDENIPIIIACPLMRSSQNGIGKQGNTDGYSANNTYKFDTDKKHMDLAKYTFNNLKDYTNVYFCPMMQCHDSKYNFGNTKVAVNPRLTDTTDVYELQPIDSVHPQNSGYMQMADEIFSTLCAVFNV